MREKTLAEFEINRLVEIYTNHVEKHKFKCLAPEVTCESDLQKSHFDKYIFKGNLLIII